jgi:hypothetical protein
MKVSRLAGALAAMLSENGARMPSTADDVFAEIRSATLRLASVRLRRYGLDSLMGHLEMLLRANGFAEVLERKPN